MSGGSSIDDSVASAFSTNKQDAQKHLTIPSRLLLDEVSRRLGFPLAQYQYKCYGDYKLRMTVIFQTSKLSRQGHHIHVSLSRIRSMDGTAAEHMAAVAAIRYIESAANMVIGYLYYTRLKKLEEENRWRKKRTDPLGLTLGGQSLKETSLLSFSRQFTNL